MKRGVESLDVCNEYGILQELLEENATLKQTVDNLVKRLAAIEDRQSQGFGSTDNVRLDMSIFDRIKRVEETSTANVENIGDLDLKFQLHENSVDNGHLIWKINNIQQRTTDAIIGKTRALHSAPCFTSKYGYKFCLRLYLHGVHWKKKS